MSERRWAADVQQQHEPNSPTPFGHCSIKGRKNNNTQWSLWLHTRLTQADFTPLEIDLVCLNSAFCPHWKRMLSFHRRLDCLVYFTWQLVQWHMCYFLQNPAVLCDLVEFKFLSNTAIIVTTNRLTSGHLCGLHPLRSEIFMLRLSAEPCTIPTYLGWIIWN